MSKYTPDPQPQRDQPVPDQHDPNQIPPAHRTSNVAGETTEVVNSDAQDEGYVQKERASYTDASGDRVEETSAVAENRNQSRADARYRIAAVISFLVGVLEIILLLRFIFRLLGANEGNSFVALLYDLSFVFVAPFQNIFTDPNLGNVGVLELTTLLAMLIYALAAWGLIALVRMLFAPVLSGQQNVTTTRRRRML